MQCDEVKNFMTRIRDFARFFSWDPNGTKEKVYKKIPHSLHQHTHLIVLPIKIYSIITADNIQVMSLFLWFTEIQVVFFGHI